MMIAGEISGDLHGAGVVHELRIRRPDIEIFGVGGDRMAAEGMELVHHVSGLSVMGFTEVLRHLPVLRKVERSLRNLLTKRRPRVVVLIDYPGFNLRFARMVREEGIPILYYISPQVWAWNRRRIGTIRSLVDEIDVILPFEETLFREAGVPVRFVGHPLLERLEPTGPRASFFQDWKFDPARKLVGLFPGSRIQEIRRILPTMLECAGLLAERYRAQIAIGASSGLPPELLRSYVRTHLEVTVVERATYRLMEHADAAVVTSGTATLETAWFGTPMVIVYRTSPLTYLLGRMLVKIPHIGLVNIVSGTEVVPELIQNELTSTALAEQVGRILTDGEYNRRVRTMLAGVRAQMGSPGASGRVAGNIIALAERH